MVKNIIKSMLKKVGLLPYLVLFQKNFFPSAHDKTQQALEARYYNFYSKFIKKDHLCFDVGAHMGSRVNVFLKCNAKVVALEPYKPCYDYMKVKFGSSIVLLNKGVGPEKETRKMFISDDPTTNSFSSNWVEKVSNERFKGRAWKKQVEMEMTSLDDLIKEYGVPFFCKIDVEGFEYDVLKGLSKTINVISFEYTVPEDFSSIDNCLKKLIAINPAYKFNYSIGESMLLSLPQFLPAEEFKKVIDSKEFNLTSCGDIYASVIPL